jgi:hypothetical protein
MLKHHHRTVYYNIENRIREDPKASWSNLEEEWDGFG